MNLLRVKAGRQSRVGEIDRFWFLAYKQNAHQRPPCSKKCPGVHPGAFCTSVDRSHPAGRVGIRCSFPEIDAWLVVIYLVVVIAAHTAARPKAKNKTKAAARIFI